MRKLFKIGFICLLGMAFVACQPQAKTSDERQRVATEKLVQQANDQIGMPNIKNFSEKRLAKYIMELREDASLVTYAYTVDMNGNKHLLCESLGYGLPYAVQYVNPVKAKWGHNGAALTIPQAEPNGLFMPDALSATWILCNDGKGGSQPVYVEPSIIVSPFKLVN